MKKIIFFLYCSVFIINSYSQVWEKVKAGSEFSLAIKSDGTLWGWGYNANGQLGISSNYQSVSTPTRIDNDKNWKDIAVGSYHSIALKEDGTIWGAGFSGNGQVGAGSNTQYEEFVQIGTDTDWVYVEAGYGCSFAIKKDSSLWAWGYNGEGQLGVGDLIDRYSPTQIGSDNVWKNISCGGLFVVGIKYDNSLWRWGLYITKDSSEYIYENIVNPFCVNEDNWIMASAGFQTIFAIKENGTLWAYGDNINYALGDSSITFTDEFIPVTHDSNWHYIEAGSVFTFAINNSGELYAWGNNMYGQLGLNIEELYITTPMQVDNNTDWRTISAAKGLLYNNYIYGMHSLALKKDYSMICVAGANYSGQLGLGFINNTANAPFICSKTDIKEIQHSENKIRIYPNPACNQIVIDNNSIIINLIHIYDMFGRKVKSYQINDTKILQDISDLKTGIYVIKVETEEGIHIRKIQIVR